MPKRLALKELRASVTDRQRAILDDVWAHIKASNIGLPERPLLEKHGTSALHADTAKLGGSVIFSNHEENKLRYNLGLVGIFLTSDGTRLDKVVERYVIALRDAYAKNKEIERFSSKDLASWVPEFTADDLASLRHILYRAHGSLASSMGGWNADEWFVSVDNDVVELKHVRNWRVYTEHAVMKLYEPAKPVGEADRTRYHEARAKPDPVWHAIRKLDGFVDGPKARTTPTPARVRKLDLSFMADDVALRSILENDWNEACQNKKANAWKSCVLLCGGVVEGLLLWQLESVQKGLAADTKIDIRYDGETLSGVLRLSREQGLIAEDESSLTDWARRFRNVIHPGNQRREGRTPTKTHADLALKLVQVVAEGVRSKSKKRRK